MHARRLRAVWEEAFGPELTRPGFINAVIVLTGWVLTRGTHAVTEALVVTEVAGRRHWAAFHRFFSRGTWRPDELGRGVFLQLLRLAGDGPLQAVIDDTLTPKKGPKVFGIGSHLDPVRSTRRHRIFVFAHCWVVLAVLVKLPFSKRPWALPVLFRLYRNLKECERRGAPYKKKTELAREMLDVFVSWTNGRRVELAADGAYCNDTVSRNLPANVVLFGAMRPDAVLTALPTAAERRATGRRRKRGRELRKPQQLGRDGRTPWQTTTAVLYRQTRSIRYKTLCAQWYRAMGERLLRIVVVECTDGVIPIRVFFCTDPDLDVVTILETYAGRWSIEVFFRDAKQLLGFADSQARKEQAVLRIAPLIGLLYSTLVLWCADEVFLTRVALPPLRPWYRHKRGLAFSDVLRAAQRVLAAEDVLDPACYSQHLRQLTRLGGVPPTGRVRDAA